LPRPWDRDMWINAVGANTLAPIFPIKSMIVGMVG
jgi:hypothetical protein